MDLLDFARGPALQFAAGVFCFGVAWRLAVLIFTPQARDLTPARKGALPGPVAGAREVFRRMWPEMHPTGSNMFTTINGYVFHLGLAIIVFGFAPHIQVIKSFFGISWISLPPVFIHVAGGITMASLLAALVKRLTSPVLKLLSTADDYITWAVTFAPLVTGYILVGRLIQPYNTALALHILSFAVLLIWFPFGKLMHAFIVFLSRARTGAHLNHRGAQL
ncbi:MAG: hypothetical protein R3C13_10650 [Hyphomonas sp.]|uniref:nitrate reductase n=1 Tax=Hyphomonas sp. TaxID=87 RepID=UPI00352742C1